LDSHVYKINVEVYYCFKILFFDLTKYPILALTIDIIRLTIGRIKIRRYQVKRVLDHSSVGRRLSVARVRQIFKQPVAHTSSSDRDEIACRLINSVC